MTEIQDILTMSVIDLIVYARDLGDFLEIKGQAPNGEFYIVVSLDEVAQGVEAIIEDAFEEVEGG